MGPGDEASRSNMVTFWVGPGDEASRSNMVTFFGWGLGTRLVGLIW